MNFETFTTENHESQNENLEQEFKKSLEEITNISITLDNIDTFADESLENLIALSESTVEAYSAQTPTTAIGKELEDLAFSHFNLTNIEETIDQVTEIQDELQNIDTYIEKHFPLLEKDVMSPDTQTLPRSGDVPMERNHIERPKLKTILFILQQNNIDFSELETAQGTVSKEQMRELPYYNITIPSLSRSVYVSDEYGNATFVFDTDILAEVNLAPDDLSDMTKDQKNEVINTIPGCGIRRIHSKHYAAHIENDLLSPIPEPKEAKEKQDTTSQPKAAEQTKQTPEVETEYRPLAKPKSSEGISYAPEGWLTNNSLADEIELGRESIKKQADKHREKQPEWFKKYKDKKGRVYEHYSPELIAQLEVDLADKIKEMKETPDAPEGWMTNGSFAKEIGLEHNRVKKQADTFRKEYPEWFGKYKDKRGTPREHYSPELIAQLEVDLADKIKEMKETPDAPEGWMTYTFFAEEKRLNKKSIKKQADTYRATNPEWFKKYKDKSGMPREHYSPELIVQLEDDFADKIKENQETPDAPEGWMTNASLAKEIGLMRELIKKRAETYIEKQPEWFKKYKDKRGTPREHYSPELIAQLEEDLADKIKEMKETSDAPEGWMTYSYFAEEIGLNQKSIKKQADTYRATNPEWFKKYKDKKGRVYEHYSPELIAQLEEDLADKIKEMKETPDAPEGWMTNASLAKEIGLTNESIKKQADTYRAANPEWFKKYKDKSGMPREHYSPELIDQIKKI